MGHDEDGPALPMECQQEIQDLVRRCGCPDCRSARRQNQGRVVDQCPRDGNALLLASRQLGRPMSCAIHEPDAPEQLMALS